jgi:hypothetical protein
MTTFLQASSPGEKVHPIPLAGKESLAVDRLAAAPAGASSIRLIRQAVEECRL